MFYFLLMRYQQITIAAIAAGIVQGDKVQRINVDKQRNLALSRLLLAERAPRDALIRIWIKDKAIFRRQIAKPRLF